MELGCQGVLMNTRLQERKPVLMAEAMREP